MKLSEVKKGDVLVADGGFPCMEAGPHEIHEDENGVYINCRSGHHYLDGQVSYEDHETLVGLSRPN